MQKREITLTDGRYLIFYTFEDELSAPRPGAEGGRRGEAAEREPEARAEAEEERGV